MNNWIKFNWCSHERQCALNAYASLIRQLINLFRGVTLETNVFSERARRSFGTLSRFYGPTPIVGQDWLESTLRRNLLVAGFALGELYYRRRLRKGNTAREQEGTPLSKITRRSQELFTRIVYAPCWMCVHICMCVHRRSAPFSRSITLGRVNIHAQTSYRARRNTYKSLVFAVAVAKIIVPSNQKRGRLFFVTKESLISILYII